MQPKEDNRWHVDKRVPIAMLVTLLTYGCSGLWFVAEIKGDVETLKAAQRTAQESQRYRDDRQDRDFSDAVSLLRSDIRELSGKLDRALERERDRDRTTK